MFFLMIRRPPRSTLFPYHDALPISAALKRWQPRVPDLAPERDLATMARLGGRLIIPSDELWPAQLSDLGRSEEHTPELQSRQYLVCRLLLEKKLTIGDSRLTTTDFP